jgi:hypothetical protein
MDLDPDDMGRVAAGVNDTCFKPKPDVRLELADCRYEGRCYQEPEASG